MGISSAQDQTIPGTLTIQTNLIAGALFSLTFLLSATAGLASPLTTAIAHNAGALFVIINSSRLLRFGGETPSRG